MATARFITQALAISVLPFLSAHPLKSRQSGAFFFQLYFLIHVNNVSPLPPAGWEGLSYSLM